MRFILNCICKALGPDDSLAIPVFTYSFGSNNTDTVFNLQSTLSTTLDIVDWLIATGLVVRSADPMLSAIATGRTASVLVNNIDSICFER